MSKFYNNTKKTITITPWIYFYFFKSRYRQTANNVIVNVNVNVINESFFAYHTHTHTYTYTSTQAQLFYDRKSFLYFKFCVNIFVIYLSFIIFFPRQFTKKLSENNF